MLELVYAEKGVLPLDGFGYSVDNLRIRDPYYTDYFEYHTVYWYDGFKFVIGNKGKHWKIVEVSTSAKAATLYIKGGTRKEGVSNIILEFKKKLLESELTIAEVVQRYDLSIEKISLCVTELLM